MEKWIIELNCKLSLYYHYGSIKYKQVVQKLRQLNKNSPLPLVLNQKGWSNRAFIIPSTVIINNVSSSHPKSILIHLPHENNARIKVPLDSAALLSAFSKARKLLVEKAERKTGKKWIKTTMKPPNVKVAQLEWRQMHSPLHNLHNLGDIAILFFFLCLAVHKY